MPDSQPLCHLDVVSWVDVVKHTAAGQLHLHRHTYADQKLKLWAHIPAHTHTHTDTEEKINICYDRKMKALLRVTTQQGMWRLSDVPTHTYMHAHTFRSSLGGPSDYSITQIKPWETKINCICWLKTGELQVSPKVTLLFFLFPASLPAPSFRYSLSKRA